MFVRKPVELLENEFVTLQHLPHAAPKFQVLCNPRVERSHW
jgi:hypothetical protein